MTPEQRDTERADRYILVSPELMDSWTARTHDGRAVVIEWGEPTGHEPDSDRWVYTPTFRVMDDGTVMVKRDSIGPAIAVVERLDALLRSVQDLETVDDDGEAATFLVVPPEQVERARDALDAYDSTMKGM